MIPALIYSKHPSPGRQVETNDNSALLAVLGRRLPGVEPHNITEEPILGRKVTLHGHWVLADTCRPLLSTCYALGNRDTEMKDEILALWKFTDLGCDLSNTRDLV